MMTKPVKSRKSDKRKEKKWILRNGLKAYLTRMRRLPNLQLPGCVRQGIVLSPRMFSSEYIDMAGCLEETLHRIMEADDQSGVPSDAVTDETIRSVLLADKKEDEDENGALEIDLGYRIHGQIMTFKRVPLTAVGFEKKMYERYKLIWMLENGITLFDAFAEWRDYCDPENGFNTGESSEDAFEDWEYNSGFSGSLYPCFEKYLQTDYQMEDLQRTFTAHEQRCWRLDQP